MFLEGKYSFLNSRRLLSVQSHYTRVCYSDASSTGCASYILEFDNTISHKMWGVEEAQKSSSFRELKAISLGLESFLPLVKGHTIKWYTDNQSVSRIVEVGSMKEDLQCLALRISSMCLLNSITLEVEWIPRSANDRADFLSRVMDYDDWRDHFLFGRGEMGSSPYGPLCTLLITKILSCLVSTAGFGAQEQRRSMPFLFLGRERITGLFHLFFLFLGSLITWLPLAVTVHLLFLLGLPLLFGH